MSDEPERTEPSANAADGIPCDTLEPGTCVADRYTITDAVDRRPERSVYLAAGEPPVRWCPTCEVTTASASEDVFCEECGTELVPGHYRLTVWPAAAEPPGLEAFVQTGLQHEDWVAPADWFVWKGLRCLVQPDAHGSPLEAVQASSTREDVAAWGITLTDIIQSLHAADFAGFNPTLDDLIVTGYRRIKLLNWKGFAAYPGRPAGPEEAGIEARQKDLADLASILTRLFIEQDGDPDTEAGPKVAQALRVFLSNLASGVYPDARAASEAFQTALDTHEAEETAEEPEPSPVPLRYVTASRSDTGRVRELNEDSLAAMDLSVIRTSCPDTMGVYVVADGVGGHDAGEIASRVTVEAMVNAVLRALIAPALDALSDTRQDRYAAILSDAVHAANTAVVNARLQSRTNMHTTVTAALIVGSWAYIANVGDSRTYLFRQGTLRPVTTDHSVVARLVAIGMIRPDEVYTHPQRNAIYRAVGDDEDFKVDTFVVPLLPDDRLVLCSDGLWDMVRDPDIERILQEAASPVEACDLLVKQANRNGGEDNISVIVVQAMGYEA